MAINLVVEQLAWLRCPDLDPAHTHVPGRQLQRAEQLLSHSVHAPPTPCVAGLQHANLLPCTFPCTAGPPGVGKTTCIHRVLERLQAYAGLPGLVGVQGFYTQEVRSKEGQRLGFDVVAIPSGRRGVLARVKPAGDGPLMPGGGGARVSLGGARLPRTLLRARRKSCNQRSEIWAACECSTLCNI